MTKYTTQESLFFKHSRRPDIRTMRSNNWQIPLEPSTPAINDFPKNFYFGQTKITSNNQFIDLAIAAGLHTDRTQVWSQIAPFLQTNVVSNLEKAFSQFVQNSFRSNTYDVTTPIEKISFSVSHKDTPQLRLEISYKSFQLHHLPHEANATPMIIHEKSTQLIKVGSNGLLYLEELNLAHHLKRLAIQQKTGKYTPIKNRNAITRAFNLVYRASYNQRKNRISGAGVKLGAGITSLWTPGLMVAEFLGLDTINTEQDCELSDWEIIRNNFIGWETNATPTKRKFNIAKMIIKTILVFPWIISAVIVVLKFAQNIFRLVGEFLPKSLELLCKHSAKRWKRINTEHNNSMGILATMVYGGLKGAEWLFKLTHFVGRAIISPNHSIIAAYKVGRRFGRDKLNSRHLGRLLGLGMAVVSTLTTVIFGIMAWPLLVKPIMAGINSFISHIFTSNITSSNAFINGIIHAVKAVYNGIKAVADAITPAFKSIGAVVQKGLNLVHYTPIIDSAELGMQLLFGAVFVPIMSVVESTWNKICKIWNEPKPSVSPPTTPPTTPPSQRIRPTVPWTTGALLKRRMSAPTLLSEDHALQHTAAALISAVSNAALPVVALSAPSTSRTLFDAAPASQRARTASTSPNRAPGSAVISRRSPSPPG